MSYIVCKIRKREGRKDDGIGTIVVLFTIGAKVEETLKE